MRPWLFLLLIGLICQSGLAAAAADDVLFVHLKNGHSDACAVPPVYVCLATLHGEGGDLEVDVSQRISLIAVAVMLPREVLGVEVPLLPDNSVALQTSELAIWSPHGALIEHLAEAGRSSPHAEYLEIRSDHEKIRISYFGPEWSYPNPPTVRHRHANYSYSNDTVTHDRIGFSNDLGGDDTDHGVIESFQPRHCYVDMLSPCSDAYATIAARAKAVAPNVRYGVAFYDAQVATNPDMLQAGQQDANSLPEGLPEVSEPQQEAEEPSARKNVMVPTMDATGVRAANQPREHPNPDLDRKSSQAGSSAPLHPTSNSLPPVALLAASATAATLAVVAYVLYTRFWRPKDVLRSEVRRELLALVTAEPGLSPSTLAKRADVARNTVVHHLQVLERAQLVRLASEGRELFVFPVAAGPAAARTAPSSLRAARHPVSREILALLQAHPEGLTRSDLHARMPVVPLRTLNYNVAKLVKAGLVASEAKQGLADVLTLAPAAGPSASSGFAGAAGKAPQGSAT